MQTAGINDISFSIKSIDILQSVLHPLPTQGLETGDLTFKIQVEQKIDASNKLIHVSVHIHVLSKVIEQELAGLDTVCIFQVANFSDILKTDSASSSLPGQFANNLSAIAISTTRGLMFAFLRGSYLHNAILPIIDTAKLIPLTVKN